jgi:predicted nucleic-acid-binding protein
MAIVDANVVLRYLLDDHPELSAKAAEILEQHTVTLPIEAACEVVYVLQKVYNIERHQIKRFLNELIDEKLIIVDKTDIFIKGLEYYSTTTLDLVDAFLWAYHVVKQQDVFTFDDKLRKYIQRKI